MSTIKKLTHNEEVKIRGNHTVKITITAAGSASLEVQLLDEGFDPISDDEGNSVFTETTTLNTSNLGECWIRAVITGDAVVLASPCYDKPL